MGKGNNSGIRIMVALVAGALALSACKRGDDGEAARKAAEAARAFAQHEKPWRDARAAELLAPDGWTSLVGLHWIDRAANTTRCTSGSASSFDSRWRAPCWSTA